MRAFDHDRFVSRQGRNRKAVSAAVADPGAWVWVRAARLRGAGQEFRRRIVVERLEDLVTFVAGHADPLSGVARQDDKVAFDGTLRATGGAAMNIAFRRFENERHQLLTPSHRAC